MNKTDSRRKLLKSIAAGTGAVVAGKSLPESWSRPVVDSVMLPAHAMTSPGNQYTNSQNVLLDNQSRFARVVDSLVPEANAAQDNGNGGPTEITCLTITGESMVKIEGLIHNSKGNALVVAQNVTVAGDAVPMAITDCEPASGIGQITVQVHTLTNNSATGTYSIGGGGSNLVPFTVTPGSCSAPTCPAPD